MKKTKRLVRKVALATVVGAAVLSLNLNDLHADVGHVSCHVAVAYQDGNSDQLYNVERDIEFDLSPGGRVQREELLNSRDIGQNSGPSFPLGYRIEGSYAGTQFSAGQPAELVFTLLSPGSSNSLPAAETRQARVSVPFTGGGPLLTANTINVGWSTALTPRFCQRTANNLRSSIAGSATQIATILEDPMNRPSTGWVAQLQNIQRNTAAARRISNSRQRAVALQAISQQRLALRASVQTELIAPEDQREFIQFLKADRDRLIQRMVWLAAEDRFASNPRDRNSEFYALNAQFNTLASSMEAVLEGAGITDRSLIRGGYRRAYQAAMTAARRTIRGNAQAQAAAYARIRTQAAVEFFGQGATVSADSILAEGNLDGFNPETIEIGTNVCAIAHITVNRCVVNNVIPDYSVHSGNEDAGTDAGSSQDDAAASADDAAPRPQYQGRVE